jgi:hypothetical protein
MSTGSSFMLGATLGKAESRKLKAESSAPGLLGFHISSFRFQLSPSWPHAGAGEAVLASNTVPGSGVEADTHTARTCARAQQRARIKEAA